MPLSKYHRNFLFVQASFLLPLFVEKPQREHLVSPDIVLSILIGLCLYAAPDGGKTIHMALLLNQRRTRMGELLASN